MRPWFHLIASLAADRKAALDQPVVELIADLPHWGAARGHAPYDRLDPAHVHDE
jgi:hypothetical protein